MSVRGFPPACAARRCPGTGGCGTRRCRRSTPRGGGGSGAVTTRARPRSSAAWSRSIPRPSRPATWRSCCASRAISAMRLLIARCAEDLAPPGPRAIARARGARSWSAGWACRRHRRAKVERQCAGWRRRRRRRRWRSRLARRALSPAPSTLRASPAQPPQVSHHRAAVATLAAGAAALIAGGVLYALAHDRARQFDEEQQSSGFTDRARTLRSDAQSLQTASLDHRRSWTRGRRGGRRAVRVLARVRRKLTGIRRSSPRPPASSRFVAFRRSCTDSRACRRSSRRSRRGR